MRRPLMFAALAVASLWAAPACAWWDEGHMQVAAVAYERLTPQVRAKVDALVRLNPDFRRWIAGTPPRLVGQYAFVRASTWADDIKTSNEPGYAGQGDTATGPDAARNIGYADDLEHQYWHFEDIPFSPDGTPTSPPGPANALTEIKALSAGLAPGSGLPDPVRSYDLVWLIHIVGDAHQPLHATTRFTHDLPHGDEGGNKEMVVPATGETIALHAYWDRLLGSYATPQGAIQDALFDPTTKLPDPDPTLAAESDPETWLAESEKLAERYAYAAPVGTGTAPAMLDRAYETNARTVARQQVALAGARLANLLNAVLK